MNIDQLKSFHQQLGQHIERIERFNSDSLLTQENQENPSTLYEAD